MNPEGFRGRCDCNAPTRHINTWRWKVDDIRCIRHECKECGERFTEYQREENS